MSMGIRLDNEIEPFDIGERIAEEGDIDSLLDLLSGYFSTRKSKLAKRELAFLRECIAQGSGWVDDNLPKMLVESRKGG